MSRITRTITGAVVLALFLSTAASAEVVEHGRFGGTYSASFELCGMDVELEGQDRGVFRIRADNHSDAAFLFSSTFGYRNVITNPETGKWLVMHGRTNFHEIRATHVDGDVYSFQVHEVGQPVVVEDSAGNVVARDRGLIVWEALFDTLGDDEPGGELLSQELVSVHGPHPLLSLGEENFCAMVEQLLG